MVQRASEIEIHINEKKSDIQSGVEFIAFKTLGNQNSSIEHEEHGIINNIISLLLSLFIFLYRWIYWSESEDPNLKSSNS